jgi:amphi-Trp domain-containing protein
MTAGDRCPDRCPAGPLPCRLGTQLIHNGHQAGQAAVTSGEDEPGRPGSEADVKLMELKDKTTLSREEAAARLHAIADELASGNDVVIERETMRFVAHVPDQVNLKVEFEVEDDGTELEIELTW